MAIYFCELCEERAAVYCCADEAYVCWACDHKVHDANFIVARHHRAVLCGRCQAPSLTPPAKRASGSDSKALCPTCSCSPELERLQAESLGSAGAAANSEHSSTTEDDSSLEEFSSATVNSSRNSKKRCRSPSPISVIRADRSQHKETEERLELVLEGWNRQLGLPRSTSSDHAICVAMQLLRRIAGSIKTNQLEKLDARSALAACLWISLKLESVPVRVDKFEKSTGISAEVVLFLEAKLCQVCSSNNSSTKWNLKSRVNLDLALA